MYSLHILHDVIHNVDYFDFTMTAVQPQEKNK